MASPTGPRIAIIGAGKVGAAAAYSILHRHIASELLLLDARPDFLDAQVQDLRDATSFLPAPRIRAAASWAECGQCDVVIFTAGTNQKAGESRLALVQRNTGVVRAGLDAMAPLGQHTVVVMVTNPVDVMTTVALRHTGLPPSRVFGSGTILDTTRLKDALAQRAGVAARAVHAYVVGEHGDSQTVAWSSAAVGGVRMDVVLPMADAEKDELAEWVKLKADRLNRAKGETSWGVGAALGTIAAAVLLDERAVLPLSYYDEEQGLCYNRPVVVGRGGIEREVGLELSGEERIKLERSIAKLKEVVGSTEMVEREQVALDKSIAEIRETGIPESRL